MKTKFLTGLALAAALFISQPVFAASHRGGGHRAASHSVAHAHVAVHRSVSHARYATVHRTHSAAIATRRTLTAPARATANITRNKTNITRNKTYIARNNTHVTRNNVAFAGSAHNNIRGNNSHGTYAFASHSGWSNNREYYWHGHHYRWYDNGWFIIDPFPLGYGYWGPNTGYYYGSGTPVSVEVQAALQREGYYQGPVDGIVGPGTQAAIAAYQRDNGLRVTGTITHGVLRDLGIG